jgi:hypothetical protein
VGVSGRAYVARGGSGGWAARQSPLYSHHNAV